MAITKPTTRSDVVTESEVHGDTVRPLTLAEEVATIEKLSDPGVLAKVDEPNYVTVTSPFGVKTSVPESIVDSLVDSGYTKSGK